MFNGGVGLRRILCAGEWKRSNTDFNPIKLLLYPAPDVLLHCLSCQCKDRLYWSIQMQKSRLVYIIPDNRVQILQRVSKIPTKRRRRTVKHRQLKRCCDSNIGNEAAESEESDSELIIDTVTKENDPRTINIWYVNMTSSLIISNR